MTRKILRGNIQHIMEHGLEIEDVEEVLGSPCKEGISRSSGLPIAWGYTLEGVYILSFTSGL